MIDEQMVERFVEATERIADAVASSVDEQIELRIGGILDQYPGSNVTIEIRKALNTGGAS